MITIFCTPKPFKDEALRNQMNALRSWRAIDPQIEILVFGDSAGAKEASNAVNAHHIPDIESSASGAPSFNSMARYARDHGRYDLQVYANCDILLDQSVVNAMQAANNHSPRFLLVGERMDLAPDAWIDVQQANWKRAARAVARQGLLSPHGPTGADYFGFTRGMWDNLPPVFMGRAMCDQALLHFCFRSHIPVIDATLAVLSIHQFHGYDHVSGGRQEVFHGEDRINMAMMHNLNHSLPTIADADGRLEENSSFQADRVRRSFLRRIEFALRYRYGLDKLSLLMRALQYLFKKHGRMQHTYPVEMLLKAWHIETPRE